jgi:hypothetical protein
MGKQTQTNLEKKYKKRVLYMVTGGAEYLVEQIGGELSGFTMRSSGFDTLLVLRAEFEEEPMVAFIGGNTGASCLARAERELRNGGLKWRKDKYQEE